MLSPGRPAVSIRTLGMFHITRDGLPVPATAWQSPKGTELLKILITQRGPVSRKHLIDLLWPQADPAVASNQLSVLLSAIRQVLQPSNGTEPLGSDGSEVWLDHAGVVVDVEQFLTLAVAALHAHRSNQRNATALLHAAATAYTGDFLPDDHPHDWAISLSDEVKITHLALLQALATTNGRPRRPRD
jgi:DNA-binding SARP family transcriptional activator